MNSPIERAPIFRVSSGVIYPIYDTNKYGGRLYQNITLGDTGADEQMFNFSLSVIQPAANTAKRFWGWRLELQTAGSSNFTHGFGPFTAIELAGSHYGTGTMTVLHAASFAAYAGNGGNVTTARAGIFTVQAGAGSTITNAYNIYIDRSWGAGTITNHYGIYIQGTLSGATLNYNIYAAGNYPSYLGGKLGLGIVPTAILHLKAGSATAATAPLKFTTGAVNTTAEAGAMEYNNTPHFTNSDATRRHIVLAPNATKVVAAAPYANDGYVVMNIGGTDFKVMTTA